MTAADSTVPHCAKYSRSVSLVVEYDNPPTYNFEAIRISFNRSSALMHAPILGRANIGGEGAGRGATSCVWTLVYTMPPRGRQQPPAPNHYGVIQIREPGGWYTSSAGAS